MKRKIIFTIVFCMATLFAFTQSPIGKGGKQLNFGVTGNSYYIPVYIGFDFGVHSDITIGPQAGLDLAFNYLNLGFRGDYHFNTIIGIPQNWDFYAGLSSGFSIKMKSNEIKVSDGFFIGAQVGGRWYWSDIWGLNVEFGLGNLFGSGRIGLSVRL
jgi:outer membrane immunogenic protein